LPDGLHALISRHVANQEMIVQAALARDRDLAFQALFNDPTNHLPIDEAWDMFEDIFQVSRNSG
jgi:alpha-galactosidase